MAVRSTYEKPPLDSLLNLYEFEDVAKNVMKPLGWGYYSSAADDEITMRENQNAFHRIFLKPRVLVNVEAVNMSTTLLGHPSSAPLFISPTALGKVSNLDGEFVKRIHFNS